MTTLLKQSTAADVELGPFVDETDGKTAETGLTLSQADCILIKNGGAAAQKNDATSASHLSSGHYKVPLNTTDTNTLGRLRLLVHEGGALPAWRDFLVVPANVYDALVGGSDKLQVHTDEITAGLITAAAIATGAIDADALATDAAAEIADAVWDEALAGHATAGSAGKKLSDLSAGSTPPTVGEIADAVWDEALSGHLGAGSAGKALDDAKDGDYLGGSATAGAAAGKAYQGIVTGTFVTGTLSATSASTSLTGYGNDTFNGRTLTVITGARAGEQTTISDHVETNGVLTFAALTGAPGNGDEFYIA